MMYWNDGYGVVAGLFMLFFWLLLLAAAVFLVRWFLSNRKSGAESILDERLARGDISVSEYHERKAALLKR